MWNAEKRLKAAEKALDNEGNRVIKRRGVTDTMRSTAELVDSKQFEDRDSGELL